MSRRGRRRGGRDGRLHAAAPVGPPPTVRWSKKSGPGNVTFADPAALITTATFCEPGVYVLEITRDSSERTASSTLTVKVETPPPAKQLDVVHMRKWSRRQHAVESSDEGAHRELDSALHRAARTHRDRARVGSTTSSKPARSCAASRTASTKDMCSRTRTSTTPSRRCPSR